MLNSKVKFEVSNVKNSRLPLARYANALNMIQENIPFEVIARITGLTIEQLQQLQSSPNNA
jgi:archaellum biogenesis ATPase FlaH